MAVHQARRKKPPPAMAREWANVSDLVTAAEGSRRSATFWRLLRRVAREPGVLRQLLGARWRLRGCQVPFTVRLRGRAVVHNYGHIRFGSRVRLDGSVVPLDLAAWEGAVIEIGESSFINYGTSISAHRLVRIGADCNLGTYVIIMDSDYHDLADHSRPGPCAPVVIGDRVWLGARTTVLKGVTIGDDTVVGAGSVVVRDLPPRCLAVGVPARVVRKL